MGLVGSVYRILEGEVGDTGESGSWFAYTIRILG